MSEVRQRGGRQRGGVEWLTLALIAGCYGLWLVSIFWLAPWSPVLAVVVATLTAALHSSLTHEVLHGHPFRAQALNEALMFLPLTVFYPYNRFRDLHLKHHRDADLTDPENDPESNFLDPVVWQNLPGWKQRILRINNTLLGRILLGPGLGQVQFMRAELRAALAGARDVRLAWVLHLVGVAIVLWIVALSAMPVWAYLIAAYLGMGLIKIRTFLEHRAHAKPRARTVIVEDCGPLSFLFLNNNLHVVHHMHPLVAWYHLPALYRQDRQRYLASNEGYVYASYKEVFARYFVKSKDPVAHPLWPQA